MKLTVPGNTCTPPPKNSSDDFVVKCQEQPECFDGVAPDCETLSAHAVLMLRLHSFVVCGGTLGGCAYEYLQDIVELFTLLHCVA